MALAQRAADDPHPAGLVLGLLLPPVLSRLAYSATEDPEMYTGLGQQAPLLKHVNPDGSVTWYFGPPEAVVQSFPAAAAAVPVPIEEQQAALSAAQARAPTPPWLVPALIGGALLLVL